jgi:hypothetical protein
MDVRRVSSIPTVPLSSRFPTALGSVWKLTGSRDRHYLNDSSDCVACSEFKGPWPDDDDDDDLDEETAEEYAGALVIDRPSEQSNLFHEAGVPPAS